MFTEEPGGNATSLKASADVITEFTMIDDTLTGNNVPILRSFDSDECSYTGNATTTTDVYRVYADRNSHVGLLLNYSGVYNIKGAAAVAGLIDWVNTPQNASRSKWIATERYPWYSFKVTQPAEVMVFLNDNTYTYTADMADISGISEYDKTGWVDISGVSGTINMGGSVSTVNSLSVKKAEANDTVTIYSPKGSPNMYVIVKPISK